ncbi:MAG: hypothetical protein LBB61_09410 [Treponema sp.]|jgi:hypothetical protein|nr:hypothetical protein [Treponema sp.]
MNDKFGKFEWVQNKSNDNVRRTSKTGSGDDKGFSFYFARYAYKDEYLYRDESLSTNVEGNYSGFLAKFNLMSFPIF